MKTNPKNSTTESGDMCGCGHSEASHFFVPTFSSIKSHVGKCRHCICSQYQKESYKPSTPPDDCKIKIIESFEKSKIYDELSDYGQEQIKKWWNSKLSTLIKEAVAKREGEIVEKLQKRKIPIEIINEYDEENSKDDALEKGRMMGKNEALSDAIDIVTKKK